MRKKYDKDDLSRIGEDLNKYMKELSEEVKPKDLSFGIKEPLSLVPPILIRKVSRCMEEGSQRRSVYNWRHEPVSAMQLIDKMMRHILDCLDGKDLTDDTKLSNLGAAAADIAVFLDAQEYGSLVDDRPSKVKK